MCALLTCAGSPLLPSTATRHGSEPLLDIPLCTGRSGPLKAWVIHRQHPGESQAEWFAEGLVERLLDASMDGLVMSLHKQFTFHIVPSMNPDGAVRGYLRTNACGANLNRCVFGVMHVRGGGKRAGYFDSQEVSKTVTSLARFAMRSGGLRRQTHLQDPVCSLCAAMWPNRPALSPPACCVALSK